MKPDVLISLGSGLKSQAQATCAPEAIDRCRLMTTVTRPGF